MIHLLHFYIFSNACNQHQHDPDHGETQVQTRKSVIPQGKRMRYIWPEGEYSRALRAVCEAQDGQAQQQVC